jgi:hypothetical protein
MPSLPARAGVVTLFTIVLPLAVAQTAPQGTSRTNPGNSAAAGTGSSSVSTRPTGTAKGPLPDPVLLDGSALEAEKRPEYGMLGEFEMAGDENAKSDKVGGQQQQQGAGGQQQGGANGGESGAEGGGSAGSQPQQGGGSQAPAQNDPSAQAQGSQVGQLQGEGASGGAGQEASRPQQVALGDSAMQIKSQANVPGVIGKETLPAGKEVPQQYDKNTPAGGKQTPGRGNQGVEKGRVMPAGI